MTVSDPKAALSSNSTETYILKVLMTRPAMITIIGQELKADDFFFPYCRFTFGAIKRLAADGDVTPEGIMTLLENTNKEGYDCLMGIGGVQAVRSLVDDTLPESPAVTEQMKTLKSLSYRRKCLDLSAKIRTFAITNTDEGNKQFEDLEEMDTHIKTATYFLADSIRTHEKITKIGSKLDRIKEKIKNKEIEGINIGGKYPKMNKLMKNLRKKALYVIGAEEKIGKSSVMLDISWYVARNLGIPTAYADTEMFDEEVLMRLLAKEAGLTEEQIMASEDTKPNGEPFLTDKQKQALIDAYDVIEMTPFFHFNANEMTNSELESKVKLLQMQEGIELFTYDYVKIQSHEVEKGRTDLLLAAKIDTLKEKIAKQCDIPVITSGQMWVDEKGKARFAETSHFTKLGDVIFVLRKNRPSYENSHQHQGTHYLELVMGRKIDRKDEGKTVDLWFNDFHRIKEL
ncbi:DnaB-like replicative helicase [Bacillus phage Staley]|uniref:DNA helicase n=1 Tax=Bacillus phage Staley TaxID=1406792 RepID=U5PY89_9CAUD|nr:DnaB-like replicative helicase [Bacillus phage Staley]AGY48761.1 DNA helicase [Bacillus phage Staley]